MTATTDTLPDQKAKEALASLWWMPLIRGILLLVFGILMFTQPGATLLGLLWVMGIYWIVDGVFSLIEGVRGHTEKSRLWMLLSGILSILGGLMMIFAGRNKEGARQWSLWGLIMGILYVLFGLFVVTHPVATMGTLIWLFSIWAIVSGVIAVVMAFQLRGLASSK